MHQFHSDGIVFQCHVGRFSQTDPVLATQHPARLDTDPEFMRLLFGEEDLDAMHRLRAAFDPDGFSNPGKVLPTPRACVETGPATRDDALVG